MAFSYQKIKTISYIDDVNPVRYDYDIVKHTHGKQIEDDWVDVANNDDTLVIVFTFKLISDILDIISSSLI